MQQVSKPDRSEWNKPLPAELPSPTYWPAALALGLVLLLWGVITTAVISIVGLVVSLLALGGWIGDVRHES
ncbi:MAG: cytochrome c oxidase subunit 4 [Bryobacteraceae bacterium]